MAPALTGVDATANGGVITTGPSTGVRSSYRGARTHAFPEGTPSERASKSSVLERRSHCGAPRPVCGNERNIELVSNYVPK